MSSDVSPSTGSWGAASWVPADLPLESTTLDLGNGELGFERPARPPSSGRLRLFARAALVLLVVAAVAGYGVYWHAQAGARAAARYAKRLPAAQAAWPTAITAINRLTPPTGWRVDPTMTACGFEQPPVLCLETGDDDLARTLDAATAWLTAAGASRDDPLMRDYLHSISADRDEILGCGAVEGRCAGDLSWHGTSIGLRVEAGSPAVGQHASVAITRGYGFPEGDGLPLPDPVALGTTAADFTRLTGLDSRLGAVSCVGRATGTGTCSRWHVAVSSRLATEEVKRSVAQALADHGFRIDRFPDHGAFLHVHATRYLAAGGHQPVVLMAVLRPDGQGHTVGEVNLVSMVIG